MQSGQERMVVHLTVDTSAEKSDNLLAFPDIAFVIEQK